MSSSSSSNTTSGNDTLYGSDGADTLIGGLGDDVYYVNNANDVIVELAADNTPSQEYFSMGNYNDVVIASVSYTLTANASGIEDVMAAGNLTGNSAANLLPINLTGNAFDQALIGNEGRNILNGMAGADTLVAMGGDDVVNGGDGDDALIGGTGNDILNGDAGNDLFFFNQFSAFGYNFLGEPGSVDITGGTDVIDGGSGEDTIYMRGALSDYRIMKTSATEYAISLNPESAYFSQEAAVFRNIEKLAFANNLQDYFDNPSAVTTYSLSDLSIPSGYFTIYPVPVSAVEAIGLSPDGQYVLIKVAGFTQSVPVGTSLEFNGVTVTTADLINSTTVAPVFQSNGGPGGYALPEVFTGPSSLNLDYQLIETADNAVVIGGATNDFIKLASTNSDGKAVDGGAGDDVIDGGVGSTFISGGSGSNTIFLDGRAPGVSWSTVTDFKLGQDKATIWGWKEGVSKVSTLFTDVNTGGAAGYTGLTLHFENLLPDDAAEGQTNSNFNSITLSGLNLSDFGAKSLDDLNAQITSKTNSHFQVGEVSDAFGDHGYLFIS